MKKTKKIIENYAILSNIYTNYLTLINITEKVFG